MVLRPFRVASLAFVVAWSPTPAAGHLVCTQQQSGIHGAALSLSSAYRYLGRFGSLRVQLRQPVGLVHAEVLWTGLLVHPELLRQGLESNIPQSSLKYLHLTAVA